VVPGKPGGGRKAQGQALLMVGLGAWAGQISGPGPEQSRGAGGRRGTGLGLTGLTPACVRKSKKRARVSAVSVAHSYLVCCLPFF